jgi:hypothetical protein
VWRLKSFLDATFPVPPSLWSHVLYGLGVLVPVALEGILMLPGLAVVSIFTRRIMPRTTEQRTSTSTRPLALRKASQWRF